MNATRSAGDHPADRDLAFPSLFCQAGRTVERDRWEKLVSAIQVPAPAEEVWKALVSPERVALWLACCTGPLDRVGSESLLDFEDGEFFLVRPIHAERPKQLTFLWRWLGIGQATKVTWSLEERDGGTTLTVTEEAQNPPWDWQTWNGGGWPGILDQLASHLRTGTRWRWPWRRMGPYVQIQLPLSMFAAWDALFGASGPKYWLLNMQGSVAPGATLPLLMGDASGIVQMSVDEVVGPGQKPPSFLPYVTYRLNRPAWHGEVPGRLWLEPAGWGKCLLQAFHYNWESLPGELQLSERRILTGYWMAAAIRALQLLSMPQTPPLQPVVPHTAPHNW